MSSQDKRVDRRHFLIMQGNRPTGEFTDVCMMSRLIANRTRQEVQAGAFRGHLVHLAIYHIDLRWKPDIIHRLISFIYNDGKVFGADNTWVSNSIRDKDICTMCTSSGNIPYTPPLETNIV